MNRYEALDEETLERAEQERKHLTGWYSDGKGKTHMYLEGKSLCGRMVLLCDLDSVEFGPKPDAKDTCKDCARKSLPPIAGGSSE